MEPNLPDLPTEIVQKIIYTSISAIDFVNLGLVCKELNLVTNLINYPGLVNYKNIKRIKNKSRFKSLILETLPENPEDLEEISPTLLNIDLRQEPPYRESKTIVVPGSVNTIASIRADLILDVGKNTNLEYLICVNANIIGVIPKSVQNIKTNFTDLVFEDPTTVKCFYAYFHGIDNQGAHAKSYKMIEKFTNLERLYFDIWVYGARDYDVPVNPKLIDFSVQVTGNKELVRLDFKDNKNIKNFELSSEVPIEIINPPLNLDCYSVCKGIYSTNPPSFYADDAWNDSLNLNAETVVVKTASYSQYKCGNRVKQINLFDKAHAQFSDSVENCSAFVDYDLQFNDVKNIKYMAISARNLVLDLGNLVELFIYRNNRVILIGPGRKLKKLHTLCNKLIGDISTDGPCQFSKYRNCDVSDLNFVA